MLDDRKGMYWGRLGIIVAILVTLAVVAGCGGNDNEASEQGNNKAFNSAASTSQSQVNEVSLESPQEAKALEEETSEVSANANSSTTADRAADTTAGSEGVRGSGGDALAADQSSQKRKLIYSANINMEVEDYAKTRTALQNIINLSGGYVLDFADQKSTYELGGTYTIKVPSTGFTPFLAQLEGISHLNYESSMKGADVTEEYVDLESRLKARQIVESRLIAFMEKATKADDLVRFSSELGDVQLEIERIKGRMRYLDQNVAFSTIELRIYQLLEPTVKVAEEEKPGFLERITDALTGSANSVYAFIQGLLVFIAGALPVLVVLAVIAVPGYMIYRRNRRRFGGSRPASGGGYGMRVDTTPGSNDKTAEEQGNQQPAESDADTDKK